MAVARVCRAGHHPSCRFDLVLADGPGALAGAVCETLRAVLVRLDIAVYCVARIILIVLPLSTLCSLPPEAFIDVNWSAYIPHL
ncbi:hypothetical protein MIND_01423500 [Mycena indigotica]|uniref:Uncharacterized protein n=1 Tax=Mycena indigotica TaxID=2126181 RepID=A0A8H6RXM8_9AGAR|nr:uncharacterized protein MIND_01423500 [Mycena indigotica]KAF7288778.1 hypothetical protein MIND_01423500 [Mycena indigotica]